MDRPAGDERQRPPALHVAPLEVGGLLSERVFRRRTVVLTSATLAVGGSFEPLARQWGLPLGHQSSGGPAPDGAEPAEVPADEGAAVEGAAASGAAGDGDVGQGQVP